MIAGGKDAVFQALEKVEDDRTTGARDLRESKLSSRDVVVGIAASGGTPYVLGGLRYAREQSCGTILLTCNPGTALKVEVDVLIGPEVGPEIITGSTRMKAGTATKMILNMISTGAMIKQGKTYSNLMVDLQPKNAKLQDRSLRILSALTRLPLNEAREYLREAHGDLKLALVMALGRLERHEASAQLKKHGGVVKNAVGDTNP